MKMDKNLATSKITPILIDYIVKKIVKAIDPEKIILFGSYARGDYRKDSDLDLFIIKDGDQDSRMLRREVDGLLWGREFSLDLFVRKTEEVEWNFRAKNPFYLYHIFKDGKILYEKKSQNIGIKCEEYYMKKSNPEERNPEEIELIKNWLALARENLLTAKSTIPEEFSPYHTVCFMCQGSAEKYLKAYLIWKGWQLEKIHDLEEILKCCVKYNEEFDHLLPQCKLLNKYITEGRYPGDLPFEAIGERDAIEAIESADKIAEFVLERIQFEH